MIDNYLSTHESPEDIEVYFCGPPLMNQAVEKMADDFGVPQRMFVSTTLEDNTFNLRWPVGHLFLFCTMLNDQELHNTAMEIVGRQLEEDGFEFMTVNSELKKTLSLSV